MSKPRPKRASALLPFAAVVAGALAVATPSPAAGTGGTRIPGAPQVSALSCAGRPAGTCGRGQLLTITGRELDSVIRVEFLGASGSRDDVSVRLSARAARRTELVVLVPRSARSGPLRLRTAVGEDLLLAPLKLTDAAPATGKGGSSGRILAGSRERAEFEYRLSGAPEGARVEALRVATGEVVRSWEVDGDGLGTVSWDGFVDDEPVRSGTYVLRLNRVAAGAAGEGAATESQFEVAEGLFPIRGRHRLASSQAQRFGGGRGHQGTDNFAACGTPLVAWTRGRVQYVGSQGRAGNYVVVRRPNGESYAYMHLRRRAPVDKGEAVFTGQRLGQVGDTGSASGCHLHIELWTAPGWYRGGRPYDSLPLMRRLDDLD